MNGNFFVFVMLFLCILGATWLQHKEKKFVWLFISFTLGVSGVLFGYTWALGQGMVANELSFERNSNNREKVFVVVGYTISTLNGNKTYVTTLYVRGDGEYVYRFENLPPKGYKSVKSDGGGILFVPEK